MTAQVWSPIHYDNEKQVLHLNHHILNKPDSFHQQAEKFYSPAAMVLFCLISHFVHPTQLLELNLRNHLIRYKLNLPVLPDERCLFFSKLILLASELYEWKQLSLLIFH